MLSRQAKATYYLVAGPIMRVNGLLHRYSPRRRPGNLKVHLGPGQANYMDGWLNLDANMFTAKCDLWVDLNAPLPFPDGTVDALYSHHVVEHLEDLSAHFREAHRCLRPGGVYRVAGPNGDSAIAKFISGDRDWFYDFPDKHDSIGGRFENFLLCRGEHRAILTRSYVEELMSAVGFRDLHTVLPSRETRYPEVFRDCLAKETETDFLHPHTLVIEGRK